MIMILYSLAVLLVVLVAMKVADKVKALDIPPVLTGGITAVCVLYISCLIPGALGLLYIPVVYTLFIALSLTVLLLLRNFRPQATPSHADVLPSSVFEWSLTGLGLVATVPLMRYFKTSLPWALIHPEENLGWDTVSYHLPGFIEYFQTHSFWSLEGPFQSYSFAFEMIGNFFSMPFHAHWGLVLADVFGVVFLILAVSSLARILVSQFFIRQPVSWIPYGALTLGIWALVHAGCIGDAGKNDIFMAACLISALSFILELLADRTLYPLRRRSLIFLVSMSTGLALAAKPSALAFVPFFTWAVWVASRRSGARRLKSLIPAVAVLAGSAVLGGFWLARNLLIYGKLSPIPGAWPRSLIANINNPALYEIKLVSILFVAGVLAVIPGLFLVFRQRRNPQSFISLIFLVLFHGVACAAFCVTPWAIFKDSMTTSTWDLRYGMSLFISAALIYSLTIGWFCSVVSGWSFIKRFLAVGISVLFFILGLSFYWQINPFSGLPGYETVCGLPKTEIYTWVQQQPQPLRIYSAGLRPYGLYGERWSNRLFYDLHSTELSPLESGKVRIAAVVARFVPDLILISVDPHFHSKTPEKPEIVEWMKTRPDCFEEVFKDGTVSGFRVKAEAAELLKAMVPEKYMLKMGS